MQENRERIIRHLNDAWSVENSLVDALETQARKATDSELSLLFQKHCEQTRHQRERIERRMHALGEKPSKMKGMFSAMMTKMSDLMHMPHDDYDEDAQLLMKSYGIEHLERAMYEALRCEAEAAGDMETARLASEIMAEEEEAGRKLWSCVPRISRKPVEVGLG